MRYAWMWRSAVERLRFAAYRDVLCVCDGSPGYGSLLSGSWEKASLSMAERGRAPERHEVRAGVSIGPRLVLMAIGGLRALRAGVPDQARIALRALQFRVVGDRGVRVASTRGGRIDP